MKHLHHKVIGFNKMEGNQILDGGVEIIVDKCISEKEAIDKAKTLVQRKGYLLQKVWECESCGNAEEQMANQRYLTALLSKHLKDE